MPQWIYLFIILVQLAAICLLVMEATKYRNHLSNATGKLIQAFKMLHRVTHDGFIPWTDELDYFRETLKYDPDFKMRGEDPVRPMYSTD